MVFQLALMLLLVMQIAADVKSTRRTSPELAQFVRTPLVSSFLWSIASIVIGCSLVWLGRGSRIIGDDPLWRWTLSAAVSFGISFAWYRYLVWLDMFERERRRYLLLIFIMACGTTMLVEPMSRLLVQFTPLVLDGSAWNDWWYSVIAIGMIEETVKLIPFLIVILATRQVNEPFDHILYGSVSALGFAFMENTLYLHASGLATFTGRAFTASVMHMFLTSIICYGIAMSKVRTGRVEFWRIPLLLALAALCHGFYDFWLLADGRPWIFTFIFFLATLQLWVIMKNNLINISPHYLRGAIRANQTMRYGILTTFVWLFMACAVLILLHVGQERALEFLKSGAWSMTGILVLLTMNFSSFTIIRGRLSPVRLPLDVRRWLLPRFSAGADLSGQRVELRLNPKLGPTGPESYIERHLPVSGMLVERTAYGDDVEWFLFVPDHPIPLGDAYVPDRFIVNLHLDHDGLSAVKYALMRMRAIKIPMDLERAVVVEKGASESFFRVYARRLPDA